MQNPEVVQNQTVSINQVQEKKLTFREKIAIASAGFTGTIHGQMITLFLLFFYTDILKVNPAYVAGLFLVARIIDAALVPVFGVFVTKVSTPWGKFVPWYMILGIPTAIFGWLTFTDFNLGPTATLVYISITYMVYSILTAVEQGPYAAVSPAVTKRVDDRIAIGQLNYFCTMVGALTISAGAVPLYKALGAGNDAKGFSILMGIVALIGILISIFQVTTVKERYVVKTDKKVYNYPIKAMLKAVFTNKAAIIIYVYILAINLANGIRGGIQLHFFKYYFNNEGLMSIMSIVLLVPTLIGVIISAPITKRFGIKATILTSVIMAVVTGPVVLFVPSTSTGIIIYVVVGAIGALFSGIAAAVQAAMMPAAMDYTEWKSGMNVNAFMGSLQGFMQTFSTALAGAIAAGALALIGYIPGVEQSNETIFGLKIMMGVLPTIILLFTASVAWFDLTEEKQTKIAKELAERRENTE